MAVASLGISAPAWRAARAAAAVGAVLRAEASGDEALDALAAVGAPVGGWLRVVEAARASRSLALVLPRPGDARGVALPRGVVAEGAIGWADSSGTSWLIASGESAWDAVEVHGAALPLRDPADALRALRACVVRAAHAIDVLDDLEPPAGSSSRAQQERLVDSWVLGPPPLPPERREMAVLGLRMLLALGAAPGLVDPDALEVAARTAVEAAYATALPRA
jgi:hypothetical protein